MENYIQNIELINNYLNKRLTKIEIQNFENRLKTDSGFNTLFDEHTAFLEGLKRQQLKTEIVKGKQAYVKIKWMRFLGISMVVLTVLSVVYFTILNKSTESIQHKNFEKRSIVIDTVENEKPIETSTKIDEPLILEDSTASKKELIKVETSKPIENVETSLKKAFERFEINTQKDTVLVCKEGTKITVKANSFIDSKGNIISRNIGFNVTEYYKLSDMLLANLSTTSNGALLETGGMLFIEAKKDESNLELKENSSIEISFPKLNKKEGMELFTGDWKDDVINWKLEKIETDEVEVLDIIQEDPVEVPFAVVEEVPVYPGCENLDNEVAKQCTSLEISKFVKRNFNTEIAKNIGLSGRQRINTIFKIDQNGNVIDIRSRTSDYILEEEANRVIGLLPKMRPGKQRGNNVIVPYSLPIIFTVENDTEFIAKIGGDNRKLKQIRDSVNNKRFEDRLSGKDNVNVAIAEANSYILRATKLGWINCDRFIKRKGKIKYKFKIVNNGEIRVNMIFKSINSILPGFRMGSVFDFQMVPKNEEIILVAIKKDNGKLCMDVIETTTQENPEIDFNFKQLTISEMKNQLKKLDKLFN